MMDLDPTACYSAIPTRDVRFDGRLFVGVKSTGIYCRPICPARTPKFENVSFHRELREPDAFPAADVGTQRAVVAVARLRGVAFVGHWRPASSPVREGP